MKAPETIIEDACAFLKGYYQHQLEVCRQRLDNFNLVDWAGLKQSLLPQLMAEYQDAQSEADVMQLTLAWIEATVSD